MRAAQRWPAGHTFRKRIPRLPFSASQQGWLVAMSTGGGEYGGLAARPYRRGAAAQGVGQCAGLPPGQAKGFFEQVLLGRPEGGPRPVRHCEGRARARFEHSASVRAGTNALQGWRLRPTQASPSRAMGVMSAV